MKRKWLFIPLIILGALLIIGRGIGALQFYSIPTSSNEPSIRLKDHLLASNLKRPHRLAFLCYHQAATESWPAGIWVKRVCGMPGDKVQIIDGIVFINDQNIDSALNLKNSYILPTSELKKLDKSEIGDDAYLHPLENDSISLTLESNVFRSKKLIGHLQVDADGGADMQKVFGHPWTRDNFGPINVPAGQYFVLGDNRHQSADSRYTGFVDDKDFKGTVFMIF